MNDTKMSLFIPINKVDEEQRMVYGIATASTLDKQNEIVDWGATKEALIDYSQWRNVREMHKPSAVGTAPLIELRDNSQEVYIGAKIIDDQAWAKCKEGVYKGFSIGGEVLDRKLEFNKAANKTINRVTKYLLNEISIVDRPANPVCRFQTVKRDTSIETVTVGEDPLKAESVRMMEKAVGIAKRSLSKSELEALPDEQFGLIKIVADGDRLIKHRLYPMPDKTHAVNMLKKMSGCDELSEAEKDRIHTTAVSVLGKKHIDSECSYCVKLKLEGDKNVETIKKDFTATGSKDAGTEDPKAKAPVAAGDPAPESQKTSEENSVQKPTSAVGTKPAEAQKPHIKVGEAKGGPDEDAPIAGTGAEVAAPQDPIAEMRQDIAQIKALLQGLLQEEKGEQDGGQEGEFSNQQEDASLMDDAKSDAKSADDDDDDDDDDEDIVPAKADTKTVEEVARDEGNKEEAVPDECGKKAESTTLQKFSSIAKSGLVKKMKAIIEPMMKENAALRERLEKLEKAPLARKGAVGTEKQKIEKFENPAEKKQQDMAIVKSEITFTDELQKDIEKASSLRKSGKALTADETAFCQRVAEKMLEAKTRRA